jgi:lactoylglutathione lyase
MPMGLNLHIAFEVTLDNLLEAPNKLKSNGITSLSFFGEETSEPSVIGWMPAAAMYFRDPDNHMIEYLTMLNHNPRPKMTVITM